MYVCMYKNLSSSTLMPRKLIHFGFKEGIFHQKDSEIRKIPSYLRIIKSTLIRTCTKVGMYSRVHISSDKAFCKILKKNILSAEINDTSYESL